MVEVTPCGSVVKTKPCVTSVKTTPCGSMLKTMTCESDPVMSSMVRAKPCGSTAKTTPLYFPCLRHPPAIEAYFILVYTTQVNSCFWRALIG